MLGALLSCRPIVLPRHSSALCPTQIHKKHIQSARTALQCSKAPPSTMPMVLWVLFCPGEGSILTRLGSCKEAWRVCLRNRQQAVLGKHCASVFLHGYTLCVQEKEEKHYAELKNCWQFNLTMNRGQEKFLSRMDCAEQNFSNLTKTTSARKAAGQSQTSGFLRLQIQ